MRPKTNIRVSAHDKDTLSAEKLCRRLSEQLRTIRRQNGLTQLDVASKIGVAASSYGQMEGNAGNCKFHTLAKIAIAIGVSLIFNASF